MKMIQFRFLDISPINMGHVLMVPKEHYENLLETPEELVGKMMAVVEKVAKAIKITRTPRV